MTIRKARPRDFPAIVKLIREHRKKLMQNHLPDVNSFFVAVEGESIVGCCALEMYSKRLAEIRSLAVTKKFQGKGIGRKLVSACIARARKKKVYELITITGSSKFFEKYGFGTFNNERFALIKVLG